MLGCGLLILPLCWGAGCRQHAHAATCLQLGRLIETPVVLVLACLLCCSVLYAPMSFFLQNPVGDMLVAFTKDQDILDESLMDTLHYLGIYGLIMLSTVITVSVTIPYFAAFGGVLILITIVMLRYYLPAATALKAQKAETAGEWCWAFAGTVCWDAHTSAAVLRARYFALHARLCGSSMRRPCCQHATRCQHAQGQLMHALVLPNQLEKLGSFSFLQVTWSAWLLRPWRACLW